MLTLTGTRKLLKRLWSEELGYDMVEYAMLLLFLALSSVAFLDQLADGFIAVLNMAQDNISGS